MWSLKQSLDLDEQEFNRWRTLLEAKTGITMSSHMRRFMQTKISQRLQRFNCETYDQYYQLIKTGVAGRIEWQYLIDQLVINETSFFRHPASFDFVRDVFVQHLEQSECFDVWSLGCSSGEEAYSLAVLLEQERRRKQSETRFSIVANDISHRMIMSARSGIYTEAQLQPLTQIQKDSYFESIARNRYQVNKKLQQQVCFSQANVMDIQSIPKAPMDLIFTQNMLVYFRKPQRLRVLDYAVERLKPGGYLLVGLGEVLNWQHSEMTLQDTLGVQVYRRG
jgi:chemotaxis protein methyltransferase CheR/type IV pilus assembly protein PilK